MARRIRWTEAAWRDLERVTDYIGSDSPYYAAAFARRAISAARSLATLAERGRAVPELGDPLIREVLVKGYRLIYTIRGTRWCSLPSCTVPETW